MPKTRTSPFDPVEAPDTPEAQAEYLSIFLIARARGMTAVASGAGVAREALYRSLAPGGNPEFRTVLQVLNALGLKLSATPAA